MHTVCFLPLFFHLSFLILASRLCFLLNFFLVPLVYLSVIIFDEPTNHLDIDAREALVQALNFYQGAVILVSHDVHLLELCAERLWRVADGGCQPWNGDIQEYRNDLLDSRRTAGRTGDRAAKGPKINRKDARRAAAEQRERNANLRHTVRAAEEEIARLTAEKGSR